MKNRALAMPEYVAQLIRLPLVQMKLGPAAEDDIVSCSLVYENGAVVSLVAMCIAKRGWFREKPMLVVSMVELDDNRRAVQVHYRETMAIPTGSDDLPFVLRFSSTVSPEVLRFSDVTDATGNQVRKHCLSTLRKLARITRLGWAWTIQKGEHQTINASEQLLACESNAGVILDATAAVDATYSLLGNRAEITQAEPNVRSYKNVTLHVSRNQRPGKFYLTKAHTYHVAARTRFATEEDTAAS